MIMPNDNKPSVVFLMGPTATGKTEIAVEIARRFPCEIISVDSAMVYRGMDIGTAKPSPDLLQIAPHALIDICDPSEAYSAARFRADALIEIERIIAANRTPLLVGGTMLYFHALDHGLSQLPSANAGIRARIEQQAVEQGWQALHAKLCEIDPAVAKRIHPNDPQRIQRALEIYELTNRPMSTLIEDGAAEPFPYHVVKICIMAQDRGILHERIERRFHEMLRQGLVDEVAALYRRGDLGPGLPAIRAVGYRQLWGYLAGLQQLESSVLQAITATRQLAKRQMTWLGSESGGFLVDAAEHKKTDMVLKYITTSTHY